MNVPPAVWDTLLASPLSRGILAATMALLLVLLLGRSCIPWLRRRFREPITSDSPELNQLHEEKRFTPTMGGLFLVAGLVTALLALGDLESRNLQVALFVAISMTVLGATDDLVKLSRKRNGLPAKAKLVGQVVIAVVAAVVLYEESQLPVAPGSIEALLGGASLGVGFVPLAVLVIVGTSNAVNLTDGLDGLACGCLVSAIVAMACVALGVVSSFSVSTPSEISAGAEMIVLAGAMLGAVLGFLWFNRHPARVFMGDTGALPLGALLGLLAVVLRQELLMLLVGGVFVTETLSVILQVGYYKWCRRRLFLCAPLHHHFQFHGWSERKIVRCFWIASALCAMAGIAVSHAMKLSHTELLAVR